VPVDNLPRLRSLDQSCGEPIGDRRHNIADSNHGSTLVADRVVQSRKLLTHVEASIFESQRKAID